MSTDTGRDSIGGSGSGRGVSTAEDLAGKLAEVWLCWTPAREEGPCSSTIGRNSGLSEESGSDSGDSSEVESPYRGPLETMDVLEEALPIRSCILNRKRKIFLSSSHSNIYESPSNITISSGSSKKTTNNALIKHRLSSLHPRAHVQASSTATGINFDNDDNDNASPLFRSLSSSLRSLSLSDLPGESSSMSGNK
ncbi:hypothetical protein QJS04_geneDACA004918 [Acorus gramineus]|uniref:Uncharacterized protein n=1 Tax=Acorus gramineus TaxID=55184 RepID=A0AAV9BTN8_ACOGR|nr:hypothetical protein QJS04_geneDACA004918 [Acorus gramineus]